MQTWPKEKTYPGADVPSDHNLHLAKLCIKLRKINRSKMKNIIGNLELFGEEGIKEAN